MYLTTCRRKNPFPYFNLQNQQKNSLLPNKPAHLIHLACSKTHSLILVLLIRPNHPRKNLSLLPIVPTKIRSIVICRSSRINFWAVTWRRKIAERRVAIKSTKLLRRPSRGKNKATCSSSKCVCWSRWDLRRKRPTIKCWRSGIEKELSYLASTVE